MANTTWGISDILIVLFLLLQEDKLEKERAERERKLKQRQKAKDRVRTEKEKLAAEKEAAEKEARQRSEEQLRLREEQTLAARCCATLHLEIMLLRRVLGAHVFHTACMFILPSRDVAPRLRLCHVQPYQLAHSWTCNASMVKSAVPVLRYLWLKSTKNLPAEL